MKRVCCIKSFGVALLTMLAAPVQATVEPENVELLIVTAGDKFLRWQDQLNRTYFVQASDPNFPLELWDWTPLIELGDGDGEPTTYEIDGNADKAFFRLWYTDDQKPPGVTLEDWDADNDDLSNEVEISETVQTNPLIDDTDGDGLKDGFEVNNGLDPHDDSGDNGGSGDPDGDGLSNLAEQVVGTDPNDWDSDGDGISDDEEDPGMEMANNALADKDGANLPSSLDTNLIGRWDFEEISVGFPSTPASVGPCHPMAGAGWMAYNGVVSHAAEMGAAGAGYLDLPASILDGKSEVTFCQWIQLPEDCLSAITSRMDILGAGRAIQAGYTAAPILHAYFTNTGTIKLVSNWINYPDESLLAEWPVPAGLDDGNWHHLSIVKEGTSYSIYADGTLIGIPVTSNNVTFSAQISPYFYLGRGSPVPGLTGLKGRVDRVRVYDRALNSTDIGALFNQDLDRDGLFDRTEGPTLVWRDLDGDGLPGYLVYTTGAGGVLTASPDETSFLMTPFYWDAADSDHDDDGITSLNEQNVILTNAAHPDTDGDLLQDGWEQANGLNPLSANGVNGTNGDRDGDGLDNLTEFRFQSNPNNLDPEKDTDGDGTSDYDEVYGPDGLPDTGDESHPADDRDGGQPIPADERLSILLAVGDESGSESEDYVMNVYRIDPETGMEIPYYLHRPGSHGKYSGEEVVNFFWKRDTYAFQIDWQSSNLGIGAPQSGDGPDYDYTLKVEPQNDNVGVVVDAYDPETFYVESDQPIQGNRSNVIQFQGAVEKKRVLRFPVEFALPELAYEAAEELKVAKFKGGALVDIDLVYEQDPDRFVVRLPQAKLADNTKVLAIIETTDSGEYDDPVTLLDLTYNAEQESFMSRELFLVSDQNDDVYKKSDVGEDNERNDRSHLVALGGKVLVKEIKIGDVRHLVNATVPVRKKQQVTIQFKIIKKTTGVLTVQREEVERQIKIAKERYAQIGVIINDVITEIDQPSGLKITNVELADPGTPMAQDEKDVLGAPGFTTVATNDIEVIFIESFDDSIGVTYGIAHNMADVQQGLVPARYGNCLMIDDHTKSYVLAHEIGHLLLNYSSHSDFGADDSSNLMNADVANEGAPDEDSFNAKRFSNAQETKIHAHPQVGDIAP